MYPTRPTVYYFCQKSFKSLGMTYYNEFRCLRILDGDPRINDLYKRYYKNHGLIHRIEYNPFYSPKPYDIEWEKKQVLNLDWYANKFNDKVIILDEKEANEAENHLR